MTEAERALLRRRAVLAGLLVSLALNAFFVGLAVTDELRSGRTNGPRVLKIELRWLENRLPKAGAAAVESALAKLQPDVDSRLTHIRTMRGELSALLAVPTPDRAAIDAKIASIRAEGAAIQNEVEKSTYDALVALPPDMRAGLAK